MASNKEVQVVEPAFQWAQNKSNIFLQVKLSMRLDSPACLICKEEDVKIENRRLFMSAYGIISHTPVRFQLNLTLFGDLEPASSIWNYESVGTYYFSLAKSGNATLWLDLEENSSRKVQLWWDMRDKYKNDMDEWSKLKEQEEERKEKELIKKEQEAKAQKKKAREQKKKQKKAAAAAKQQNSQDENTNQQQQEQ